MPELDELHSQNHKLIESSNVLLYLLQERSMCDTEAACNLLYSFLDDLEKHQSLVGGLYQGLLSHNLNTANNTARMFMSGEHELKRIISQYTKKWCIKDRKQIKVKNHDAFKKDTEELFLLVLSRIQNETEHLYPMVKITQTATRNVA